MTNASATPAVSVIVRATRASREVAVTLASICEQTFTDWEVVFVHDGWRDATLSRTHSDAADRIHRLVVHSTNAGVARNAALAVARGRYVAFLEVDDLWTVDFLERQVRYLEAHPWCHLVYCDANLSGDAPFAGRRFTDISPSSGRVTLVSLIDQRCAIPLSTVLARRAAIVDAGAFDETLDAGQAYDLWLRLAHRGSRISYRTEVLADCRVVSTDPLSDLERTLEVFEHFGRGHVLPAEARRALRTRSLHVLDRLEIELAKRCFLEGNFAAAKYHLGVPRTRPFGLRMALLAVRIAPRSVRRIVRAASVPVWRPVAVLW